MSNRKNPRDTEKARKERIWLLANDPEHRKKQQKVAKKVFQSKEVTAKRNAAIKYRSSEFKKNVSERNRRFHALGLFKDPFKDDFEVVVKERPNDYAGVLTEDDYQEMMQ